MKNLKIKIFTIEGCEACVIMKRIVTAAAEDYAYVSTYIIKVPTNDNTIAKENNIKEIYYYNIKEIRNNNTEKYKEMVKLLGDYLSYDDSSNKRIFVPNVVFVKNGKILANDNETALINDGSSPEGYWTEEAIETFRTKMNQYFEEYTQACSSCN